MTMAPAYPNRTRDVFRAPFFRLDESRNVANPACVGLASPSRRDVAAATSSRGLAARRGVLRVIVIIPLE